MRSDRPLAPQSALVSAALQLAMGVVVWVSAGGTLSAQEFQIRDFERQKLDDTYYSEGIAVGDINGDSWPDVVYGPYWFAGPDFSSRHEIYDARPQPTERYADHFFAWIHDFDRDGANDVLAVGFPGTPAHVYCNPGKGVGPWTKHAVLDWVSNESPQFANLVGSETPELICTRDGFFGFATIDPAQPLGPWAFHPISEQIAAKTFGHGLGVGDINGDGRQDIIHAGGWFEQPEASALNARWRAHDVSFSSGGGGAEMYAYDVDGDGDNDVITSESAHNFGVSWYEQTEPNKFVQHVIVGSHASHNKYGIVFSEPHSLHMADIDGDGLKDIVTGKTYWSHHKQSTAWDAGAVAYWFKLVRTDEGIDWLPFLANGETGIGRQITVADINRDGQPDIAMGGMLGANILLQQTRTASQSDYQDWLPEVYQGPMLIIADQGVPKRGPRSPVAADGKMPSAIEGENLNASVTSGTASVQSMSSFSSDVWSNDKQLWWRGATPGDSLSIELDVFEGIEAIQMALTCARDYAIVDIRLDGASLHAPIDLYDTEVMSTGLLEFATPKLRQGKHELTFNIVGANPSAAKSYMVGIDYLRFRRGNEPFEEAGSVRPQSADGRTLNLDFETGTLDDWIVEGAAFRGQPVQNDLVQARRGDMSSNHRGKFWIGGFELDQDSPTGTLTSVPFLASEPFASFYFAGGNTLRTRVELNVVGEDKPFYQTTGRERETLERYVVDLSDFQGKQIFIKLLDEHTGHWGHLNFDHFRLHRDPPGRTTQPSIPLTVDEYPHSGLDAQAAAAAMVVPDGFHVSVCAAEPDVKQPIAMAFDDRGRVWIAEAYEYPQRASGEKGRDRILVFEDTTGDGQLDSRKVFYEGLNLVSGLEVGFGGVWVGAAPYLMFIADSNQDDIPDSEPQILLDGWGYEDTHETLNSFCWGPDGWLYGCHGVFTHSRVGKPDTPGAERVPLNAGVWRYHPTQHEFEVFAHGTSNPWGVDFNAHGEAFITACVIPHLFHIIPAARYQRQAGQHFNPHTYDDIKTIADHLHYLGSTPHIGNGKSDAAGGGHAHSGAMIYQGGKWPAAYDGVLFMNNIHGQRLNTDLLMPSGSGYVGKHGSDFLLTKDMASQILNMRYGPDGNVVFIDWYDMQACHRKDVEVHDRSNGRIYRVNFGRDSDPRPRASLRDMSDVELAELCLDTNNWYVKHARRLLQERSARAAVSAVCVKRLRQIATTHADDVRRLRAVWALYVTGSLDEELHRKLRDDSSPYVRSWSIRLQFEQSPHLRSDQIDAYTRHAESDASPIVRRSLASVAAQLPLADRWDLLESLTSHAEDAGDHNLPLLYWYGIEPLADADPDRALALAMTAGRQIPDLRTYMLRRLGSGGEAVALERLVSGLKDAPPELKLTFVTAIQSALTGQRRAEAPSGWAEAYQEIERLPNEKLRFAAMTLSAKFGDSTAIDLLNATVGAPQATTPNRLTVLRALLDLRQPGLDSRLLEIVSDSREPAAVRKAAILGLTQYDNPSIPTTLIESYVDMDADEQRAAIATLCSRAASAVALLRAIGDQRIPAADLTADYARQLEYLEDPDVDRELAENWGQVKASSATKQQSIDGFKELVSRNDLPDADLTLGKQMFAKTCQRCHKLFGEGENIGPDLTGSNRANLDYLLENIVDPSAVMANEYRQSVFLTDDNQVITGIVLGETEQALSIRTAENVVTLPKDEIIQRKDSSQSMMPENQLSQFTEHQVRSLIRYLQKK